MGFTFYVNAWQKPLQYCKVISLQLIKINEKKKKPTGHPKWSPSVKKHLHNCFHSYAVLISFTLDSIMIVKEVLKGPCSFEGLLPLSDLFLKVNVVRSPCHCYTQRQFFSLTFLLIENVFYLILIFGFSIACKTF